MIFMASIQSRDRVIAVLFKVYLAYLSFMLFTSVLTYTRLLGIWNHVHALFLIQRGFDLIFITFFCFYFGSQLKLPRLYYLLFLLPVYPLILGVFQGNSLLTLVNDFVLYLFVLVKILIFKAIFTSIKDFSLFERWLGRYIKYTVVMAVLMLVCAYGLSYLGYKFYFQAPLDITYVSSYFAASGSYLGLFFLLCYAALSGKRMILIGMFVVILCALFKRFRLQLATIFRWLGGLLCVMVLVFTVDLSEVPGLSKVAELTAKSEEWDGEGFADLISRLDPSRYTEVVSLWRSLDAVDLFLGKGFGYRYQYDLSILNFTLDNKESHSNSHFTPMGVISKFGFIGLLLWSVFLMALLVKSFRYARGNPFSFAAFVFLLSLIAQSMLAFTLFGNLFFPLVAGYILSLTRVNLSRVPNLAPR